MPYSGIRYRSRLEDGSVHCAIFEPESPSPPLRPVNSEPVSAADPEVREALSVVGLRVA